MFKTISQLFYSQPEPNQPQDIIKARSYEYKSGENLESILKFIHVNHLPVDTFDSEPKGFRISAPKETHNALTQHGLVKDKYDRIKFITQALPQSTTGEQVKQAIEEATNLHIISCDKHTVKYEGLKINSNRWYAYAVDDKRKYLNPLQKFFFINQRKYSFDPIGRCRKCWAPDHLTKNCGSNENLPPQDLQQHPPEQPQTSSQNTTSPVRTPPIQRRQPVNRRQARTSNKNVRRTLEFPTQ